MADEYWKRYLTGSGYDWGYEDDDWETDWYTEDYQYTPEPTDWASQESISFQESYPPYEGDIDSSLWYSQDKEYQEQAETQSFLDIYTPEEIASFGAEGGEAWDAPGPSWYDEVQASITGVRKGALGTISSVLGGIPVNKIQSILGAMSGRGARGQAQRQQRADGVSQRGRMPTQSGGGPTRMTKAQATQSAAARIQAAGGSSRGNAAAQLMARTNARVNNANNLQDIISAALSGQSGAGGKGQKTIALSSALRQLKLPRYSA